MGLPNLDLKVSVWVEFPTSAYRLFELVSVFAFGHDVMSSTATTRLRTAVEKHIEQASRRRRMSPEHL